MIRYFALSGLMADLTIATRATDEQMDGTFRAVCTDTGDVLNINGWLIEDQEQLAPSDARTRLGDATCVRLGWLEHVDQRV